MTSGGTRHRVWFGAGIEEIIQAILGNHRWRSPSVASTPRPMFDNRRRLPYLPAVHQIGADPSRQGGAL